MPRRILFSSSHGYHTSGASETILVKFFSRSSLATGPKTRVPTGSFASLINTAALSSNVSSIAAPVLFSRSHHHRAHYFALLDLAIRRCFFHRRGDHVSEARHQSRISAYWQDASDLARAGIVGDR